MSKEHRIQSKRAPRSQGWINLHNKTNNDSIGLYKIQRIKYWQGHTEINKIQFFLTEEWSPIKKCRRNEGNRKLPLEHYYIIATGKIYWWMLKWMMKAWRETGYLHSLKILSKNYSLQWENSNCTTK